MSNKTVSIIIPAYNCKSFIQRTVNSVLAQTYPKEYLEVIIVNDGSTDNTAEIINTYKNTFKIIHTKNRGVSYARNEGLKHATGNFIQYLDSDDLLEPNKIEIQVKALLENNADVAYGNWQRFEEIENQIIHKEKTERQIEGNKEIALFTDFWCPPAAILYSRNIVDKIGPWKQWLYIIQDARYFLDAALNDGKFVYTNAIVAQYREGNPNSLSKKENLFIADCFKNTLDIYSKWKNELAFSCFKKKAILENLNSHIANLRKVSLLKHSYGIKVLLEIDQNFLPKSRLKYLSRLLGYKKAEIIARKLFL